MPSLLSQQKDSGLQLSGMAASLLGLGASLLGKGLAWASLACTVHWGSNLKRVERMVRKLNNPIQVE